MGNNQNSWALIRPDGLVETFLRIDLPENWEPPEGYSVLPDDELPENWQKFVEPNIVPQSISARQIRLWLIKNGFSLSDIEIAINSIQDQAVRDMTLVEWEYAPYVERNHPMVSAIANALGLNNEQIDTSFIEASRL
jgi:hypothetical protein